MTESDVTLLEHLATHDREIERLLLRHQDFETRIARLERHKWLSPAEQREVKQLKRHKLAGRDRMQSLLARPQAPA